MKIRDDGFTIDTLPSKLRSLDGWPRFDAEALDTSARDRFEQRRRGIEIYLSGASLRDAADEAHCSSAELSRLIRRCLSFSQTGEIIGLLGLVKNVRCTPFTRSGSFESKSSAGMFTRLLASRVDLERFLKGLITSRIGPGGKISRKSKVEIGEKFLAGCLVGGIEEDNYPFNSESKSIRSVYRYIDEYLDRNTSEYDIWFGSNSNAKLKVGQGDTGFSLTSRPFDLVHIDAHRVDVIATIQIETEHGPKCIGISRIWIVVLLDAFSGAVLGYSVSYEDQVSAETVERAILSSQRPWFPRSLSAGLRYKSGACLPAGAVRGLDRCPIVTLRADNFSSHYADLIQRLVRRAIGIHISYGPVGSFFHNALLENFFGVLTRRGIQFLHSSVGSGPKDPLRPQNPVKNAVESALSWQYIEDLLEVELTAENVRPGSGRSQMAPMEIIRNHMQTDSRAFFPRPRPHSHPLGARLGYELIVETIRGSNQVGNVRRPYIEFYGRRYRHPLIENDFSLVGKNVRLYVRREDCQVEAYFEDGRYIGQLTKSKSGLAEVSLSVLKSTYNSKNKTRLPEAWAIEAAKSELRAEALQDAKTMLAPTEI